MNIRYRLLIVDNEVLIVARLLDLFQRMDDLNLEVHGAYSSAEALDIMNRIKIDLVLSDIRMPGKSGLELQAEIVQQWPQCKVIFLTGYDDFNYVHQAIRNGSIDFLLKTEGEAAIIKAVEKAIKQLDAILESEQLMIDAKSQMEIAKPFLQRELLCEILHGEVSDVLRMKDKFEQLSISLKPELPVLLVVGRVDEWRDGIGIADKDLLLFAIQNIAAEYLRSSITAASIIYDKSKLIWFLQPNEADTILTTEREEVWKRATRFVHGTLESIQNSCSELLKVSVSFAVSSQFYQWSMLSAQFDRLMLKLGSGLGLGIESLLIDHADNILPEGYDHEVRIVLRKRDLLPIYLDNGQRYQFFADFDQLISLTIVSAPSVEALSLRENLRLEIYYALVAILLSYVNRWGLHAALSEPFDLHKLARLDYHQSWNEAVSYIAQFADALFTLKSSNQLLQEDNVVQQVEHYVAHNLAGDLSLVRMGEVVKHNPQYLSRLYKQVKGIGLSEYISSERLTKAKELLELGMKVSDVSQAVGFLTEQSFYRFFKKHTKLTPHEYRNSEQVNNGE